MRIVLSIIRTTSDNNLRGLYCQLDLTVPMFAFSRVVTYTKTLVIWQHAGPLRLFSASSTRAKTPWSKVPEIRREQYDRNNALSREKYKQDEEYRKHRTKLLREYRQARSDSETYISRRRDAFFQWIVRGCKNGAVRSWSTHTPEYGLVQETRRCADCGFYRNRRLWWRRNDETGLYDVRVIPAAMHRTQDQTLVRSSPARNCADLAVCSQCHICFTKDWSRVRSTGYEHTERHGKRPVQSEQESDAPSDETPDRVKSSTESRP